jgi:4a-hydroxytetrahydrobiopterin dehydratase
MNEAGRGSDIVKKKHCVPCEGHMQALEPPQVAELLRQLPGWGTREHPKFTCIERSFRFTDYSHVVAFANAVAWLSIRENHHPVLELQFRQCVVTYYTHSVGGLSENDFVCATEVNTFYDGYTP